MAPNTHYGTAVAIFASVSDDDSLVQSSRERLVEQTCRIVNRVADATNYVVGEPSDKGVINRACQQFDTCRPFIDEPGGVTELRDRVRRVARELFDRGYDRVVLLASDVPTLTTSDIERTIQQLKGAESAVVGPSPDGGFNYLGLSEWRGDILRNVPFFTNQTRERLLDRLRQLDYRITTHRFHRDIDDLHDWLSVAGDISRRGLKSLIRQIIQRYRQWRLSDSGHSVGRNRNESSRVTRGPPVATLLP